MSAIDLPKLSDIPCGCDEAKALRRELDEALAKVAELRQMVDPAGRAALMTELAANRERSDGLETKLWKANRLVTELHQAMAVSVSKLTCDDASDLSLAESQWLGGYDAAKRGEPRDYFGPVRAPKLSGDSGEVREIVVGSTWERRPIRVQVVSDVGGVQFKRVTAPDGFDYEDVTTREFCATYTWVSDPDPAPVAGPPLFIVPAPLADYLFYWETESGAEREGFEYSNLDSCRGCGEGILPENRRIADGCPCNSPRGINHGLVPKLTCTCVECDPEKTGGTRHPLVSDPAPQSVVKSSPSDDNVPAWVPPVGKRVVVKEIAPGDTSPEHKVGEIVKVTEAVPSIPAPGFIVLNMGTHCRVEPACTRCLGAGRVDDRGHALTGQPYFDTMDCGRCLGTGVEPAEEPADGEGQAK